MNPGPRTPDHVRRTTAHAPRTTDRGYSVAISRRAAFKIAAAGAATAVVSAVKPVAAKPVALVAPPDAVGLLYDTTKCIGCKACVSACREANGLDPDTTWSGGLYNAPLALSAKAK